VKLLPGTIIVLAFLLLTSSVQAYPKAQDTSVYSDAKSFYEYSERWSGN
jgi:hypothetical protein